jgi:hypothetical protein
LKYSILQFPYHLALTKFYYISPPILLAIKFSPLPLRNGHPCQKQNWDWFGILISNTLLPPLLKFIRQQKFNHFHLPFRHGLFWPIFFFKIFSRMFSLLVKPIGLFVGGDKLLKKMVGIYLLWSSQPNSFRDQRMA